jgi:P27 family predicted phage terminase small subunit
MGRRGPIPRKYPDNVAQLRSGVSHSQPKQPKRKLRPKPPARPHWLTPFGRRIWDRTVKELEPFGLLSVVDRDVLAGYCDAASFAREARDQIRADGLTVRGQNGEQVRHPAFMIWRQSVAMVESLGTKLALNPSARLRLLAELPDDLDDDDSDLD